MGIIIYCEEKNQRIEYIFNYVFRERLGIDFTIETDVEKFKNTKDNKLNYSKIDLDNSFHIYPNSLLFEKHLNHPTPRIYKQKSIYLFPQNKGNLRFDIFSASFWLLSRYEEYVCSKIDNHGRFCSDASLAHKQNFITRPLIDEWIIDFKAELSSYFPKIEFKDEQFEVQPTIDIDSAWCYKNKGLTRVLGANLRDLLKGRLSNIKDRTLVILRLQKDPHYQFNWLRNLYQQLNLKPLFFILVSEYSQFDKNTSPNKKPFLKFINQIKEFAEIGIHFSYYASENDTKMEKELKTIEQLIASKITKNRQHFLRFQLPEYYQKLETQGITDDYTMGYADQIGFRAGTSRSFLFYDLEQERITNLRVHPFSIMDVSLKNYQKLSKKEALASITDIINQLEKVNGKFVTLWHNESVSNYDEWENWQALYQEMLNTSCNLLKEY